MAKFGRKGFGRPINHRHAAKIAAATAPPPPPNLSPAEIELLACLSEEMGEAIQAIGKTLRHGYHSCHPETRVTNKDALERELGDVSAMIDLLCESGPVNRALVYAFAIAKRKKLNQYLHHNRVEAAHG
jgi:NTP pyrophosphatase (non-canonical NTP hydrolase)